MHAWEAIQKTLDYIETNISEEFDIEQLAKEASLSLFYYQRLFSRLVKRPVREYIKLRRLSRACELLDNKQRRILEIALDHGFGSHETFTRAFKEAYGMTPEQYREHPVMLNHFDKPDLLLNYIMIDEGVPLISDGLVLEFNRKILENPVLFMGMTGFVPIEGTNTAGRSYRCRYAGRGMGKVSQRKAFASPDNQWP
jgi:AraC family transcriptional regulator